MSSFIRYRDKGVWLRESTISMLAALFAESLRLTSQEPWAMQYADTLDGIARNIQPGHMSLKLDDNLQDDSRTATFREAVKRVLQEMVSSFSIPVERLRRLPHPEEWATWKPLQTDLLLRYAVIILLMLEGAWAGDETFEIGA
jgi:hypothetical protein